MSVPTRGDTFAKLIHNLREAQSCAATMAHHHGLQSHSRPDQLAQKGWLGVSELLGRIVAQVTKMAMKGFH